MGEDDVPLLLAQRGNRGGVPGGEPGMIEALVSGVCGPVLGVIEIQVVEQGAPDSGAHIHMEHPRHPIGAEGHKQGVVQGGHRTVVLPPAHHPHLLGVQQLSGQLNKFPFPQLPAQTAHWNQSFPHNYRVSPASFPCPHHTLSFSKCHLRNFYNFTGSVPGLLSQI